MVRFNTEMPNSFEIVVGTYEQYLLGYKVETIANEYKVEKSFATHDHLASIRGAASNKHYLASAGADDSVFIYDMRYRSESGRLMHHSDTVNCVIFSPEASHVFTCSNDGSIAAIHCGNWQLEKHWQQAHKGFAVNTFAIHPTGKIGLSTGGDGILRTWNLVKGRQAYATNLVPRLKLDAKNISVLKWSPNGAKYLLAANQIVDVYSVDLAGIDNEIKFKSKVVCAEFLQDDLIVVGFEDGTITLYDLNESVQTLHVNAHNVRVKCITHMHDLLVTASSSGEIKLWRFTRDELHMLHNINCGARITCLTIALPCKLLKRTEEIKVEGKNSEKKSTKFSLKQEVIIEEEGNWEVTNIETAKQKQSKGSKKNKRKTKVNENVTEVSKKKQKISIDNARCSGSTNKKKKSKIIDFEISNLPRKKKKKPVTEQSDVSNPPLKKTTKSRTQYVKLDTVSVKKGKTKLRIPNDADIPSRKKKRLMDTNNSTLKKKKIQSSNA